MNIAKPKPACEMVETIPPLKKSVRASDRLTPLPVTKTVNNSSPENVHATLGNIVYRREIEVHSLQIQKSLESCI